MMKKNVFEKELCKTQERLFRYVAKHGYDMEDFVSFFMNSDFANLELDSEYTSFNASFAQEILEILDYKNISNNTNDENIAAWIGYIYRLIQVRTNIHSKDIYQKIPYSKMKLYWIGGHTMDDDLVLKDLGF